MKLRDLIPEDFGGFIKREVRPCTLGDFCSAKPGEHTEHEYYVPTASIDEADGVWFYCPKCYTANGGMRGTHSVICWRPRVPADVDPKPGRWEFQGTGLDDLTLVADSSSILLRSGCCAHFFVQAGEIVMA